MEGNASFTNQTLISVLPGEQDFFERFLQKKNIRWDKEQKDINVIALNRGLTGYIKTPIRTVHIQPKFKEITLEHVLRLYNYLYVYDGAQDDALLDISASEQSDNIVASFITNLKHQMALGILQEYHKGETNTQFLKGTVNYSKTYKNMLLQKKYPVQTEVFQLSTNTPVNQLIVGALMSIVKSGSFQHEAHELVSYFGEIPYVKENATAVLNTIDFNSKNVRYKRVASDAAMIIDSLYYDSLHGTAGGESFLVNFDALFEQFVQKILIEETAEHDFVLWPSAKKFAAEYDQTILLGERAYKPDLLYKYKVEDANYEYQSSAYAVLDVKNKAYSTFKNADVYQILLYTQLLYSKKGLLIYPSFFQKTPHVLVLENLKLESAEVSAVFLNISAKDALDFKESIRIFIKQVNDVLDCY